MGRLYDSPESSYRAETVARLIMNAQRGRVRTWTTEPPPAYDLSACYAARHVFFVSRGGRGALGISLHAKLYPLFLSPQTHVTAHYIFAKLVPARTRPNDDLTVPCGLEGVQTE